MWSSGAGRVSDGSPEVFAVRHGRYLTSHADVYHRWSGYGEAGGPLEMAYYFWVVRPADGSPPTVLDTGFRAEEAERRGRTVLCTVKAGLAALGIAAEDVGTVVLTHLHYDHVGNIGLFPRARIVLARQEYDFWCGDPIARRPLFARHTDPKAVEALTEAYDEGRVHLFTDRVETAAGVEAIRVGGHTPGQLLVTVAGRDRRLLLSSDAAHYYEELERDRPTAVHTDLAAMYRVFDLVTDEIRRGATFVPGHDPLVTERFPSADCALPSHVTQLA